MSETSRAVKMAVPAGAVTVEDRARRLNLFRTIARFSMGVWGVFLVGYTVGIVVVPGFPVPLLVAVIVAIVLTVSVLMMVRRGMFETPLWLYVGGVTIILFVSLYYINGSTGPIVPSLLLIAIVAAQLGGRRLAYSTAAFHIGLYILLALLEITGVVVPFQIPEAVVRLVWMLVFVVATTLMVVMNQQFVAFMQAALASSQARERALTEANVRAQEAVEAERMTQSQATVAAERLHATVRLYSDFLERITQGDFASTLDMDALAHVQDLSPELIDLGQYLNTTVSTLVSALEETRVAQQRYLQQSWESVAESRVIPTGYRLTGSDVAADTGMHVEIAEDVWLDPMTEAVSELAPAIGEQELAVPIVSGAGAQLIGALGLRRKEARGWSEDELAIITAVTDQLAQTIENLRLIDETTRRATREQTAGEITARVREAVEIESVLERALAELGQAFAAERGSAYLALDTQKGDSV